MYLLATFNYQTKENNIIFQGSKRNTEEEMEKYIYNFIDDKQGVKNYKYIKNKNEIITREEWNKNIRYWATISNNYSKITIKTMIKDIGFLYNTYPIVKLESVYIINHDILNNYNYIYKTLRDDNLFNYYEEFNNVIDELEHVIKQCDKSIKLNIKDGTKEDKYKEVITELKNKFINHLN